MRVIFTANELQANYDLYRALTRELPKEFTKKGLALDFDEYIKEAGFLLNPDGTYSVDCPEELFIEMHTVCRSHLRILIKAGRAVYAALEMFKEVYKDFTSDISGVVTKINKLTRDAE